MKRREAMKIAALSPMIGLSGCTSVIDGQAVDTILPDGIAVETSHWSDRILAFHRRTPPDVYENPEAPEKLVNPYPDVFIDRTRAMNRLQSSNLDYIEEAIAFIETTDFDQSYVIAIDWEYSSSSDTLSLDRIERTEHGGLHVQTRLEQPEARLGDGSAHTLAIRVTDSAEQYPAKVSATVDEPSRADRITDGLFDR